jgi:hypothetical protein
MSLTRHVSRALAALLLSVVGGVWFTTAPSHAQEFCKDGGVNVVVDFQELGGGVSQECVEDGGGKLAAQVFEDAGFDLTPVGAFPGAACQIDGKPTEVACRKMPPANAYWGLYLANGKTWDYAPKGADQLKLDEGAYVAFSWQSSKTPALPRVAPTPAAEPTGAAAQESESNDGGEGAGEAAESSDSENGGFPLWGAILAVVAIGAGVGAALFARRRRDGA